MEELGPYNIPPSARLVQAAGELVAESLHDEYQTAPSERRIEFARQLKELNERERLSVIEDANIRLRG